MHGILYTELRLDFLITPVSPISIQARETGQFVRAPHPYAAERSVYIPGGTLKGTLRHTTEHIVRRAGLACCTPDKRCASGTFCPVCTLFGSSAIRGRMSVTDAFPLDPLGKLPVRDSDRRSRHVSSETVVGEGFYGSLSIRNFERWQVGLLAQIAARLNLADIQIGGNRSLGMGQVLVRFRCLSLLYFGPGFDAPTEEKYRTTLHGAGELAGIGKGFVYPDAASLPDLPSEAMAQPGAGYLAIVITDDDPDVAHDQIDTALTTQAIAWGSYIRTGRQAQTPFHSK